MEKNLIVKGTQKFLGKEMPIIEGGFGECQKVILAKTVAEIHDIKVKEINKLINNNIKEFKFGIDILDLKTGSYEEPVLQNGLFTKAQWGNSKNIYILSEQGYFALVQLMKTEKAKEIRKQLRREYFKMRETIKNNDRLKKPRQTKVVKERITDYTITGMRKTLENSKYFEIEKNINDIIEYHRNLSINFRDKAYQKEEFKDKTKYVNLIKNKIVKILEDIKKHSEDYVLRTVVSKIIEDLLKELIKSNNISSSIKMNNLKKAIEEKDGKILLLNPPMEKFLNLEFYGFSFNDMYRYYENNKVKRTVEYNNWMFDFPYDKIVESFSDVDLTRPAALFVKYTAPASNDIDNFVKSTQDAVAGALGCNDNKIHKINAERIDYCERIEDGKIFVYLRNLNEDEINENKLIIK